MNINKHIVFDLDGTLADTQKIHQKIESDFLKKFGVNISPENIGQTYAGRSPQEWIPELLREKNKDFSQEDIDNFVDFKDETVVKLLKNGEIDLMDGTKEILEKLYKKGYKMGISSGACREFIDEFIKYFDFSDIIDATTSANEVVNKKPAPDVFQKSFDILEQKFGKAVQKIVVGDGWSDVLGGKGCNAMTIWINENNPKNPEFLDHQVKNIKEIYNLILKN